jgi:ATP-dependent DNA helicase RecQ
MAANLSESKTALTKAKTGLAESNPNAEPTALLAPTEILQQVFGFGDFRPGQQEAISRLLKGQSVLAVFPTGSGKSLCYQCPALMFDGLTVVISPLIALMKDQIDFLRSHDIPAARLDSSLSRAETLEVFKELNGGRLRILYVSPERLGNERFLHDMSRREISLLAVDEAHCISQWGHNFRPDYLKIAALADQLRVGRVLALTATATPQVAADIACSFNIADGDIVHTGFYRPNLQLRISACRSRERDELLIRRLSEHPRGPTIVYVTLQRTASRVAAFLASRGIHARPYHAGMKHEERTEIQDEFMAAEDMIIVATIAFGMGVDKSNIRAVYHYNLPQGLESYMQEIGRAGRDGKPAVCEMLACAADVITLENFSYGDTPTVEAVKGLVRVLLGQGPELDISIYDLSIEQDVRDLVVKTLLTYLELDGFIKATGPFYTQFKFQPLKPTEKMIEKFDPDRQAFLTALFKSAHQAKKWFTLDANQAAHTLGQPRGRIVAALNYLEQQGDLVVEAIGVRHGYRRLREASDQQELAGKLHERFLERERHQIERVAQVVEFASHPGCLTGHLLNYFGERLANCGHCDRCLGKPSQKLLPASRPPIDKSDRRVIGELKGSRQESLAVPRQLARFLCGIRSPATSRAGLRQHPEFGRLHQVPFADVLNVVETTPERS